MNTPKQPVTPQPDELVKSKPPVESVVPLESTVVESVSEDVKQRIKLEEETRQLCEKARLLMQEADKWDSKLRDDAHQQIYYAEGNAWGGAGYSFDRKKNDIRKWQREDGRQEFIETALGKLLEALEMIRGRGTKEACTLQNELIARFSPLLNEYKKASMRYGPYGELIGGNHDVHHEFLEKFLKIACGFDDKEGLPVGLEGDIKAWIDELIRYPANSYRWGEAMDKGMDLLVSVCPFYRTSAIGEKMFKMIMEHLDGLMKWDIKDWIIILNNYNDFLIKHPNLIKEATEIHKDLYQEACDNILRRNNLPEHKFERERKGGGLATGQSTGDKRLS